MKKTLIALAVLAVSGAAVAQSSVSIDGIIDAGYQSINYKGADNTVNGIAGNGSSTTQFNLRGTEDLGGGLKANFRFETDFNAVSNLVNQGTAASLNTATGAASAGTVTQSINGSNTTFGNGEIRVGLQGGFGRVDAGAVNYNSLTSYTTGQPFGTAIGSGFRTMYINDAQATSQVRAENAVRYQTPTINGFTASLYKSNKQDKAVNVAAAATSRTGLIGQANAFSSALGAYDQVGTTEVGLNYAAGPLAASVSQIKQDFKGIQAAGSVNAAAGTTESTVTTVGANYAITGSTKLFGLYQTNATNTKSTNNKAMTASVTHTMGAIVLMAQVGNLENAAGVKTQLTGIGADYNLSKRTAVYFRNESIDDKAGAMNAAVNPGQIANAADAKFGRTAVGIRHNF